MHVAIYRYMIVWAFFTQTPVLISTAGYINLTFQGGGDLVAEDVLAIMPPWAYNNVRCTRKQLRSETIALRNSLSLKDYWAINETGNNCF